MLYECSENDMKRNEVQKVEQHETTMFQVMDKIKNDKTVVIQSDPELNINPELITIDIKLLKQI